MTLRLNWVALVKTSPNLIYKWPLTSSQQLRWRWGWCWGWCWCVHDDRFCDFICIMNLYFEFVFWICIVMMYPELTPSGNVRKMTAFVFLFVFVFWICICIFICIVMMYPELTPSGNVCKMTAFVFLDCHPLFPARQHTVFFLVWIFSL